MNLINYVEAGPSQVDYNEDNKFGTPYNWIYPRLKTWANLTYRHNTLLAVF